MHVAKRKLGVFALKSSRSTYAGLVRPLLLVRHLSPSLYRFATMSKVADILDIIFAEYSNSTMSPSTQSKSTSVFHALGSYADRTKDAAGKAITPNGSALQSPAAEQSPLSSSSPTSKNLPVPSTSSNKASPTAAPAEGDDDEPWETVRNTRQRPRVERNTEEKRGSNSRNWRERDEKPKASNDEKEDSRSRSSKKESRTSSTAPSGQTSASVSRATSAGPSKPAWGGATAGQSQVSPPSATSTSDAAPSASGSANGTARTTVKNGDASTSSEPSAKGHASDEGSWRARPKAEDKPVAPKQPAPPPAVNAWDLRKKQATVPNHGTRPSTSTPLQFGSVAASSGPATSEAKVTSETTSSETSKPKKKKKDSAPPPVSDTNMWPDVNAAKGDEKKSKQDKKPGNAEPSAPVEEPPTAPTASAAGKKAKWTPIPAAELQEAADKAAESSRQRKAKRGTKDDSESKGQRGKKSNSDKKGGPRAQRSGSHSEPHNARINGNAYRFNGSEAGDVPNGAEYANGAASAPMSRAGSALDKRSPGGSQLPLSPEQAGRDESSRPSGSHAAQHSYAGNATLPRAPRGRDREGRGYSGRGRGGYRSVSQATQGGRYELSPLQGTAELAHAYTRGYGMGYSYYPMPPAGFVMPVDPSHATYPGMPMYARGPLPPPPLPVTQIPNLDPLRYWVLGQVEYYFSMQNLAMDFFLRQQMDLEGWIDIAMIASFNRIKSLTPDVTIVREVMDMSSLLEVKGDKVRLGGGEAKRWVLPDAKPSSMEGSGLNMTSPKKSSEATEISHGLPPSVDTGVSALGIENMIPVSPPTKFDVENALMKSSGSANVSSTASVLASDDAKTMTPATSIAGDTNASDDDASKGK